MKKQPVRMSFEQYQYLLNLLDKDYHRIEMAYLHALDFMDFDQTGTPKQKSSLDTAVAIFHKKVGAIQKMKQILRSTVAETYKNHPNKEMRKFWGV